MELDELDTRSKKHNSGIVHVYTREDIMLEGGSSSDSFLPATLNKRQFYIRRWAGLLALCLLNVVAGLNWLWFSAIALNTVNEFRISLEKVNWLGTCVNLVYLPVSVIVPLGFKRWGIRVSCAIGSLSLLIGAWVRFAGTIDGLSPDWAYALLLIGQILAGCGQPWLQILGTTFSEMWFDGRTTPTMIISIASPVGAALSQLIAPAFSTVSDSILILAIITSATVPTFFFIYPPPPTLESSTSDDSSPSAPQIFRALTGKARPGEAFMSVRERIDMAIVTLLFGVLVAAFSAFSILINQIFSPYGYTSDEAGIMGGVLILAGIVGAAITSPLFDAFLANRLALAAKILVPIAAMSYVALIWDVRASNYAGLYAVIIVIGIVSFTLLPIALDIGSKVTRSPETSSAVLWFAGNLLSVVFVLSMSALRDDSPAADPPSNMRGALIFLGCFVAGSAITVFGLKGENSYVGEPRPRRSEVLGGENPLN